MSSSNSSSRYTSFNNRSSAQSDRSSSTELNQTKNRQQIPDVTYALAKSKSAKNEQNFSAMVRKFMERKSSSTSSSSKLKGREFVVAADVTNIIADDLKKNMTMTARRGGTSGLGGLHKKLFGSKVKGEESGKKKNALTEVKVNTRSLAMVLRSERELLSRSKDQESEIMELKLMLEEKNREVDKLKDLCLEQREEIKALKSVILFPEVTNSQSQQEDDSELKEVKEIIPTLQKQVTSLTGQLQSLAHDLAEVKADKYSATRFSDSLMSSPKTPTYEQEEAFNSLEFSSGDHTTHGSADDMFLEDLNPCLTPYIKSNSKAVDYISYSDDSSHNHMKKSWVDRQHGNSDNSARILGRATRRSDESKCTYRKNVRN
ncbi:unnamed protein product [Lactuca virosa]|uniref:Uncharacterized protein n=1 Tax=Lactuca virosa TaxID=75947 RepID=A0AAU9MZL3_9ASTR|nr:unnamed protein product [Lactuca virosa]